MNPWLLGVIVVCVSLVAGLAVLRDETFGAFFILSTLMLLIKFVS